MVLSCNGATQAAAALRCMARLPRCLRLLPITSVNVSIDSTSPFPAIHRTLRTQGTSKVSTEQQDQLKFASSDLPSVNHETDFRPNFYSLPLSNDPLDESFLPYMFRMRSRSCPRCGSAFLSDASLHSHLYHKHPDESEALLMDLLQLKPIAGNWRRESISAQIDRSNEGVTELSLYVCPRSSTNPLVQTTPTSNPSQAFHINVKSFKMNSEINFAHSWRRREWHGWPEQTNSQAMRHWMRIIRWLSLNTAQTESSWVEITVSGSSWHLRDFYLHTFARYQSQATPLHPVVAFDRGTMKLLCDPNAEEQIRADYNARLEMMGDDPSDFQRIETPARNAEIRWEFSPPSADINDYLQHPDVWTKESFLHYIDTVTDIKRSETMADEGGDSTKIRSVLDECLFTSSVTKPFVSWAALHKAFEFVVQSQPAHEAWRFLEQVEQAGFSPNVELYNVFLARQPIDYSLISLILTDMTRRGVMANMTTWVALAGAAPSINDHSRLMRYMRSHSLSTDIETERRMAVSVIKYSFGTFLDRGGLISSYMEVLNSLFPHGWLSGEALAALVHGLGIRLRMLDAIVLVDSLMFQVKMESPGEDIEILRALLKYCHLQSNTDLAIWTIVYAAQHWRIDALDRVVLPFLLGTAWNSQMHNVLRAAWVYGAFVGEIDAMTHRRMFASLRNRANGMKYGRFDSVWRESAGPVACRTEPDPNPTKKGNRTGGLTSEKILQRQYKSFLWQEPSEEFAVILARALVKDKIWRVKQHHLNSSVEWMLDNTIEIPKVNRRWGRFN